MKKLVKISIAILIASGLIATFFMINRPKDDGKAKENISADPKRESNFSGDTEIKEKDHPMSISLLRNRDYLGGDFVIEETLANGANYRQLVVSYRSDGLKIYGLLTVPLGSRPKNGYPAVVFIHGHIPPKIYSTTGSYPGYQATLARSGMVTFKPDLRGHGRSEGEANGAHFSVDYVIDTMNAIAYLKNYPEVDPGRIGYWGHSNGGEIGLRVSVLSKDVKAYSLWAGVVGTFEDELETYNDKIPFLQKIDDNELIKNYGFPSRNPDFWSTIDPYTYLSDVLAPVELQHATGDKTVPIELSRHLRDELEKLGKKVEYIEYIGDDHNISDNASLAWQRTIGFFKKNL